MNTRTIRNVLTVISLISLNFSAPVRADDWVEKTYEVTGEGTMTFSYPVSWGKKPSYKRVDPITDLKFGPYGPKSKPIFLAHLQAVVAVEPIPEASLMEATKVEVENFRASAFETDIPINDFRGPHGFGYYFSITDSESKRGEFDYMTLAVIASKQLLVKVYFLSSDGAPDFGADAMQMMESIKYVPKPAEE